MGFESPFGSSLGFESPFGSPLGFESPFGSPLGFQSPFGLSFETEGLRFVVDFVVDLRFEELASLPFQIVFAPLEAVFRSSNVVGPSAGFDLGYDFAPVFESRVSSLFGFDFAPVFESRVLSPFGFDFAPFESRALSPCLECGLVVTPADECCVLAASNECCLLVLAALRAMKWPYCGRSRWGA